MKVQYQGDKLLISGITALNPTNAGAFRDDTRAALTPQQILELTRLHRILEIVKT